MHGLLFVGLAALLSACAVPLPGISVNSDAVDESIRHRFEQEKNTAVAKNVILFIGDGMGVSTVTGARIFDGQARGEAGEEHARSCESFPNLALVKTYNTNQQVPDSAGTATAMLAGVKTRAGVIGIGPEPQRGDCIAARGHELTSIAVSAELAGKSTGLVTSTRITHATPASLYAHSPERDFESDAYMTSEQKANCVDIARQLLAFDAGDGLDVVFGGGYGEFVGATFGGIRADKDENLIQDWLASNAKRQFVKTAAELDSLKPGQPALGLFSRSHLDFVAARKPDTEQPTLTELTSKAIDLLSANDNGYFLLVEGGRIDHGHHYGMAGLAFTEAQEFSRAISAALEKVDLKNTLVLVTADHSHTLSLGGYPTRGNPILGLVVGNGSDGESVGEPDIAADGQSYTSVAYANGPGHVVGPRGRPDVGVGAVQQSLVHLEGEDRDGTIYSSESHGGEDVALYAAGPWAHLVGGVLEQQAIYHIMRYAYGLDR